MFTKLKRKIAQSALEHSLKRLETTREFLHWDNISTIGLACDITCFSSQREIDSIVEAFAKHYKQCSPIIFSEKRLNKWNWTSDKYPMISKENLTWSGIPKGEVVESYVHKSFDVVFIIEFSNHFIAQWIGSHCKAKMVIAPIHEDNRYATLLIQSPINDVKTFIEQSVRYLKIINQPL
ncbi:MAG TPA: hypothetical protein PK990_07795 [Salinivirgaceae bacterium]|nr:hypothetical protein [Salinivirgaceae bacterium]